METKRKKYPAGIQTFSEIIEKEYEYVDKTALIYEMTHSYKYVFLSRPRRFGKSLLCSTLKSYFEGRNDLMEVKLDGSSAEALKQIHDKDYDLAVTNDNPTTVIGMNFSTETATLTDWIIE